MFHNWSYILNPLNIWNTTLILCKWCNYTIFFSVNHVLTTFVWCKYCKYTKVSSWLQNILFCGYINHAYNVLWMLIMCIMYETNTHKINTCSYSPWWHESTYWVPNIHWYIYWIINSVRFGILSFHIVISVMINVDTLWHGNLMFMKLTFITFILTLIFTCLLSLDVFWQHWYLWL